MRERIAWPKHRLRALIRGRRARTDPDRLRIPTPAWARGAVEKRLLRTRRAGLFLHFSIPGCLSNISGQRHVAEGPEDRTRR